MDAGKAIMLHANVLFQNYNKLSELNVLRFALDSTKSCSKLLLQQKWSSLCVPKDRMIPFTGKFKAVNQLKILDEVVTVVKTSMHF